MDHLAALAAERGLWGLENLSGIPGEVGASAVQNVGAYGVEAADRIVSVEAVDLVTGETRSFSVDECGYAYRDSIFKHSPAKERYFITHVTYRLSSEPSPVLSYPALRDAFEGRMPQSPEEVRSTIIAIRDSKLPSPDEVPSAGSFFKNPVVDAAAYGSVKIPAAFLIEQCGWKGYDNGRVAVWHKQPLVLTNPCRQASGADVLDLETRIIASVAARYGITLSPEAEHIDASC